MRVVAVITSVYGILSVALNATMRPFRWLPGLYVFTCIELVTPAFGFVGAQLLLSARGTSGSGSTSRGSETLLFVRSRPGDPGPALQGPPGSARYVVCQKHIAGLDDNRVS